jgi:hypothetical protein
MVAIMSIKYYYRSTIDVHPDGTFTITTEEHVRTSHKIFPLGFSECIRTSLQQEVNYAKVQIKALEEYKEKNGSVGTSESYDIQIAAFKRAINQIDYT